MIRVAVADDELLVRIGLQTIIDWKANGFTYSGDAPDGERALALVRRARPHILITDVVMPKMNGLELIESVKKEYPETRIIVLSSYNEYDYLRRAMKLGADDYILKSSLKPAELMRTLGEISKNVPEDAWDGGERTENESQSRQRLLTPGLIQATEPVSLNVLFKNGKAGEGRFCLCLFKPVEQIQRDDWIMLIRLIEQQASEWGEAAAVTHENRYVVLSLSLPPERGMDYVHQMCLNLLVSIKRFTRVSCGAGVSAVKDGTACVQALYLEAVDALNYSRHIGDGQVRLADNFKNAAKKTPTQSDDFYEEGIKEVLAEIRDHYSEEITIRSMADKLHVSCGYFGYLFKRSIGKPFVEYLNELRISKAAEYLTETKRTITDIAEAVGYPNVNYFGRLFKAKMGVGPKQYRLTHRQRQFK